MTKLKRSKIFIFFNRKKKIKNKKTHLQQVSKEAYNCPWKNSKVSRVKGGKNVNRRKEKSGFFQGKVQNLEMALGQGLSHLLENNFTITLLN